MAFFLAEDEGFVCIFFRKAKENNCSHQCLHWWQQYATGILHLDLSNPYPRPKQNTTLLGGVLFWQRMRDSNPRKRSQSPVCYRYTNPLCVRHGYYYSEWSKNVKHFFPIFYLFSSRAKIVCPGRDLLFTSFFPREGFTFQQGFSDVAEGRFLSLVTEHGQKICQFLKCLRVHQYPLTAFF